MLRTGNNVVLRQARLMSRASSTSTTAAAGSSARTYQYFDEFEVKQGVAVIRLNGPGKMNTISQGMQKEAEAIFRERVLPNKDIKAVVFLSSKPDNFIAGADIDMIKAFENKQDIKALTMKGHSFFEELKKTKLPMVAGINGVALGGGLEWALYCDYRVATTSKKTALGLPEVKLGLLPGMGGTYHLPKLVGYATAMDMMLTGKNIKPDKAKKMGLVDLVVDPVVLEDVCIRQALGLVDGSVKVGKRKRDWINYFLEETPLSSVMFKKARETVDKQSGGHYPAPYGILDVLQQNMGKSKREHLEAEAKKFCDLAETRESEALIGIFHGMNAVKKHDYGVPKQPVKKVAVLGAGLMGSGIAQVSVDQGKYTVLLKDKDGPSVSRGEKAIVAAAAMDVGTKQGKTAIFVKDVPGFFVNRCLAPFMSEVTALVTEGVNLETLDKSLRKFGMPVGPITLSDEVGIDVSNHVGKFMSSADLGVRMHGGDASLMAKMVEKGWLGRKAGKGFYLYPKDAKKGAKKQLNPEMVSMLQEYLRTEKGITGESKLSVEDIQWRAISRFVNEAAFSLQDGIIRGPADGDIGAVFGIGFPPFLGGPFRMLDIQGVQGFVDRMYRYRDAKGEQFEPAQILKDHAKANKKFHA
eukprot:gene4816-3451_t